MMNSEPFNTIARSLVGLFPRYSTPMYQQFQFTKMQVLKIGDRPLYLKIHVSFSMPIRPYPQLARMKSKSCPVLPYVGAFAFVRDAEKPSNVNSQDNHSQFLSIHGFTKANGSFFSKNN
jgi:hypothetical protein